MNRLKILLCLCLGACFTLSAQEITLAECQRLARENYPLIRQYDLIAKTTELSVSNAAKAYLPQVSLSAQATYQSDVASFPERLQSLYQTVGVDMKGLNKDQYKVALDVTQIIWDGGATRARQQAERADGEVSQQSVSVELYALNERINDLYFGILLLDKQLAQNTEATALLQSNYSSVEGMVDNHVALQSDLDAVEVELLAKEQQRTQIESAAAVYRKMLAIFTGKETVMTDNLVMPQAVEPDASAVVTNRPELSLFDARLTQLDARRSGIDATHMPQFGAFAQGFYGNPGLNLFKDMTENKWSWNYIVGITMRWNIGSFYTRKNNLSKIEQARKQIETSRETFLFNTSLQLTQEREQVERMRKIARDDARIIELRTSIRKSTESQYANGVATINDVLRDLMAENQAKIMQATHEIEIIKGIYDIKTTLNEQ